MEEGLRRYVSTDRWAKVAGVALRHFKLPALSGQGRVALRLHGGRSSIRLIRLLVGFLAASAAEPNGLGTN